MAESDWRHFTLDQFYRSDTAIRKGIDNKPQGDFFNHIDELVMNILDPLCDAWGSGIYITSGYRCDALNKAIGGSTTSAHSVAYAADMCPKNGRIEDFKQFVMKWLLDNNIMFDQFINEYSGKSSWVHVGIRNRAGAQRKQYKLFRNGTYSNINPLTFKGTNSNQQTPNSIASTTSNTTNFSNIQNNYQPQQTFTSTTSGIGYGILTGKNVYLNDIDIEAIKNNDVFAKSESGELLVDPVTGEYLVSDDYLLELTPYEMDEETDKSDLPNEPDPDMQAFIESLTSSEIETVQGISYNADGSYAVTQSRSLRELMQLVWSWVELIEALKRAIDNYEKNQINQEEVTEQNEVVINAMLFAQQAFDKFGNAIKNGLICPNCGKRVKALQFGGYCSAACMIEDLAKKALSYLLSPNDKYKDLNEILNLISKLLELVSLTLNALSLIPDIIKELCHFPEKYRRYVEAKICEGFAELQVLIQKAMMKKNDLMKKMLAKMQFGIIMKPFATIYVWIEEVQKAMEVAQQAFDKGYDAAMAALESLKATGSAIDAESFAWMMTPRSFQSPMPYTNPDAGKLFVNLPGGSGLPSLSLIKPLMPSGLCNFDFSKIDALIQSLFPPLTSIDYYLDPELFQIRYLFSDQSDLVAQVKQYISDFMTGGPDYLPAFENLLPVKKFTNMVVGPITIDEIWLPNIGYLWFLLGLADAWGPHSKALVGSLINPAV